VESCTSTWLHANVVSANDVILSFGFVMHITVNINMPQVCGCGTLAREVPGSKLVLNRLVWYGVSFWFRVFPPANGEIGR
jgi:hypothetical protein